MTTVGRSALTADHDHGIHRLGADHFLGIHRHQVAQIHRGRMSKALGDRDRREHHRHRAGQHHAALHRLDDLGHVAVAGIVVAIGVGDADDRPVQRVVGIAHRLDEGLAQEQRKPGVAVTRQTLAQSVSHILCSSVFSTLRRCPPNMKSSFRGNPIGLNPESSSYRRYRFSDVQLHIIVRANARPEMTPSSRFGE
jgi:hypothetical protein